MQEFLELDVGYSFDGKTGLETSSGSGVYDGYVVQAPWLPKIIDGLLTLNEFVAQPEVGWTDVNAVLRQSVSYEGNVKALPLDSDYIALGYRQDVLEAHYGTADFHPPQTLEELVELSEELQGKDHNGDGEPDWGFCLTPQPNYFYAFVAPVLQTTQRECFEGGVCDGPQTENNMFFDATTMEPLMIGNPGFAYAVELHHRFLRASNCGDQLFNITSPYYTGKCDRKTAFPTGKCAGVISMPGTMTKLLGANGGKYAPGHLPTASEYDETSGVSYWGRRTKFPGSTKVWNRATNTLDTCTSELCPKSRPHPSDPAVLVNYAPYFPEGGESYALRAGSKGKKTEMILSFMQWLAALPSTEVPLSGFYRNSHLGNAGREQLEAAEWPTVMIDDLFEVLGGYFSDDEGEERGNGVQDLLIIGFSEYMDVIDTEMYDHFLLAPEIFYSASDNINFGAAIGPAVDAVAQGFNAVTEKYGRIQQLQRWRNSLNLPFKSDEELCALTALTETEICALQCKIPGSNVLMCGYVEPVEEKNHSNVVRLLGTCLGFLSFFMSFLFFGWTVAYRQHPVVKASQVPFLLMVLCGAFISSAAIFAINTTDEDDDDNLARTEDYELANITCMAQWWLYSIGFTLTFAPLFAKILRIKLLLLSKQITRAVVVTKWQLSLICGAFLAGDVFILTLWQLISPLRYQRTIDEYDGLDNAIESTGSCESEYAFHFRFTVVAYHVAITCFGIIVCYQARSITDALSEGKYVTMSLVASLEVLLLAAPVLALVRGTGAVDVFVRYCILFINNASILFFIFIPKMIMVSRGTVMELEMVGANIMKKTLETHAEKKAASRSNRSNSNGSKNSSSSGSDHHFSDSALKSDSRCPVLPPSPASRHLTSQLQKCGSPFTPPPPFS
jgi:gamma-aminobutyric acid type B receptor